MSWLLVSLIAQTALGTSAIFDKLLLRRKIFDPLAYTFWSAALGALVVVLLPFGFANLAGGVIATGLLSGAFYSVAAFFFFTALKRGEASVALPIVGGLAPLFTLLSSNIILGDRLNEGELLGFLLLVAGGLVLLAAAQDGFRFSILLLALSSSVFFGIANTLHKAVFEGGSFITGLVWIRVGALLAVMIPLAFPALRRRIVAASRESGASNRFAYISNRAYAALGGLLGSWAIFLAHPALVDATATFKYVVIFFGAWIVLKERFRGKELFIKIISTILIVGGLSTLALTEYLVQKTPTPGKTTWGITFSVRMAEELGLEPKETYEAMLRELAPQGVRLVAYWDRIEREDDVFDFSELDWQMDRAAETRVPVILAVGQKVPRWPECHVPSWAREATWDMGPTSAKATAGKQATGEKYKTELFEYLEAVVQRYKDHPALEMWQVENEPFLLFGECPHELIKTMLGEEVAFVQELDPAHSVLTTDGGEFGDWYRAAKRGDVFGTTLYRKVFSDYFGHFTYPLTPEFYPLKSGAVKWLSGKKNQKHIVIELGLEPWDKKQISELPPERHIELLSIEDFKKTIAYARATKFDTHYLWGVEWWYWMKTKAGHPEYWDTAKSAISGKN